MLASGAQDSGLVGRLVGRLAGLAARLLRLLELVVVEILPVQLLVVLLAHAGKALEQGQVPRVDGLACAC